MILNKVHPTAPKTVFYSVDGTGRDTYINLNSGGFFAPIYVQSYERGAYPSCIKQFYKPPTMDGKKLQYQSDGSGRDSYIAFDNLELAQVDSIRIGKLGNLIIDFLLI